jgi:flagellin-like hook-associated protein FlgL
MSNDVTLTASIRSNLLSLQGTQRQLDDTQIRLSTGRKVNSALDDPNAFFAAQGLTARADDLSRLLDGIGQAIQTIEAADNGLTALTNLLEQAQSIAETARDQASGSAFETSANLTTADQADLTNNAGIADGEQFTLQAGTTEPQITFTVSSGDSLADLANQINGTAGFSAQIVDQDGAGNATDRRLEIRTTNGEDLISIDDSDGVLAALGFATLGTGGTTDATVAATTGVPEDRVQLEGDYGAILTQIDQLVQDTGYRGTNLLNGDSLSVQFNEDNSSFLNIAGVTYDSSGLNLAAAQFDSDANIQSSLDEVQAALDTVRAQARTFGSNLATLQNREDFTRQTVNTLTEGADKLTLADLNEESAKLLSLQTTQNLGITSLSLAAQSQQSVLRLF